MSSSVEIAQYTHDELKKIFENYSEELTNNITNMSEDIRSTLVEDLKIEKNNAKYNVAVLDVGGSFFKISMVKIKQKDGKLSCKIKSVQNFPYPSLKEKTFWYDWVAKKYIDYIFENKIRPDFCSLIFSYPIKYEKGIARPVDLAKHWCFELEKTLNSDLQKDLNIAIKNLLKEKLRPRVFMKHSPRYLIYSVLNDSVATFFSSKILLDDRAIGIILGTGTNGAFIIDKEDKQFVYNTEWGSFEPKDLILMEEEETFIKNLKGNHNLLDILVGNGYKCALLNQIIETRELSIPKVEGNCVGEIMKRSDEDIQKLIVKGLIRRSRQIMSMMVCASVNKMNCEKVTILLNGSGYSDPVERDAFLKMIERYAREVCNLNVEMKMYFQDGLTFIGAAYYAFAKYKP